MAYRHLLRAYPEIGEPPAAPDPAVARRPAAAAARPVPVAAVPVAAPAAPVAAPAAPVEVRCLGALQVRVGGEAVRFRTQKARDLLAYLVAHRGQAAGKEKLLEALWPEGDPAALQELFHTSVYQLRRSLQAAGEKVVLFSGGR